MNTLIVAVVASFLGVGAVAAQTATVTEKNTPDPQAGTVVSTTPPVAPGMTSTDKNAPGTEAMPSDTTAAAPSDLASTDKNTSPAMEMVDMTAQQFVDEAASGGMFEVQSSQLALDRIQSPEVKAFAEMMIHDHTMANEKLKAIAEGQGLMVPAGPAGSGAEHMKAVMDAEDANFDRTYAENQIQAHEEAIQLFEAEAASSNDAKLAEFAKMTLPTLKMHLEHARMLSQ